MQKFSQKVTFNKIFKNAIWKIAKYDFQNKTQKRLILKVQKNVLILVFDCKRIESGLHDSRNVATHFTSDGMFNDHLLFYAVAYISISYENKSVGVWCS